MLSLTERVEPSQKRNWTIRECWLRNPKQQAQLSLVQPSVPLRDVWLGAAEAPPFATTFRLIGTAELPVEPLLLGQENQLQELKMVSPTAKVLLVPSVTSRRP